MLAAGLNFADV
jgi:hypothetical protein